MGRFKIGNERTRYIKMKRVLVVLMCFLSVLSTSSAEESKILSLKLDATINPGTADYVISGVKKGNTEKYNAIVVHLNTPGGLLPSTQSIVESFLGSEVPVLVYVSPSGGGAISAGVFITMAAHFASMAPGTNIGAAHPVSGGGQDIDGDMRLKAENFASSLIKAIAEQRGRNTAWAVKAVKESVALTDTDAIKEKVVDFSSASVKDFLESAKGEKYKLKELEVEFPDLSEARIDEYEMSFRQTVVNVVSDPSIASLLGVGAFGGIVAEFYHPGLIVPGTLGVLCLILTLVASQVIPINTGGVILLIFGMLLMLAEMFVPSFGVLGIVGFVCLVFGSVYVVDTSMVWAVDGFGVDTGLVVGSATLIGIFVLFLMYIASTTLKSKVVTGKEGLIGRKAEVKAKFILDGPSGALRGKVFINGELWNAEMAKVGSIPEVGAQVVVIGLKGLTLITEYLEV